MTQKDAVYEAIVSVLNSDGISFTSGATDVNSLLTRELRARIAALIVLNFQNGLIELSDDAKQTLSDSAKLRTYVSGLISNWVRKDSRLNAGLPKIQKTVNRTSNDPQLKAMRHLLNVQTDPDKCVEIQKFIDKRTAELNSNESS